MASATCRNLRLEASRKAAAALHRAGAFAKAAVRDPDAHCLSSVDAVSGDDA